MGEEQKPQDGQATTEAPTPDNVVQMPGQRAFQTIGDTQLPYGYEAWDDGLFMVHTAPDGDTAVTYEPSIARSVPSIRRTQLKFVCAKPIWPIRFGRDMVTGKELVELASKDLQNNRIFYVWVPRALLADRHKIVALVQHGFMTTTNNAQSLVAYFERVLKLNGQSLPWVQVARRAGAIETSKGWGWLVGETWVGPESTEVVPDPLSQQEFGAGFGTSGSETAWFEKFDEICQVNPTCRWLTFSSFAAPLLRFVRRRTFLIHHWGQSGKGKTALAKFGSSVWGDAHKLTEHFNRTEKSFTEMFEYLSDLPLTFDELQASTNENHANVIYHICLEKGRRRATKAGGIQASADDWRSVVRMTGEEPIIGKGKLNLGGQTNRVIQLNAPGLSNARAGALHRWLEAGSYGWGGYRFLTALRDHLQHEGAVDALRRTYATLRNAIESDPAFEVLGDRTGHLAVVALAQFLVLRWIFGTDRNAAKDAALSDAIHVAQLLVEDQLQNPSTADQALQMLRDHVDSQAHLWFDTSIETELKALVERSYGKLFGVIRQADNEVWLIQGEANRLLQRQGLPPRTVWADLKQAGILKTRDIHHLAVVRKLGKFRNRVYVLNLDKFYGDEMSSDSR